MIFLTLFQNEELGSQYIQCMRALDLLNSLVCWSGKHSLTVSEVWQNGFVVQSNYLLAVPEMGIAEQGAGEQVSYRFCSDNAEGAKQDYDYLRLFVALHAYVSTLGTIRCRSEVFAELQFRRHGN
jgi:hypothetical protein